MPHYLPLLIKLLLSVLAERADIIWDFDDDIFVSGEISQRETQLLLEKSSHIIVVSEHVKSLLPRRFYSKVIVLPTTDKSFLNYDLKKIMDRHKEHYADEVHVVWVGTSGNLKYIDRIIKSIDAAAGKLKENTGKSMVLYIVCNHKYKCNKNPSHVCVKNILWSRENAKKMILKSHIGIMPLDNTIFAKGKGGFKLIQYMASGLPVIADDVGFNRIAVGKDAGYLVGNDGAVSWDEGLYALSSDIEQWEQFGKNAYKRYGEDFNFADNLDVWKNLLVFSEYRGVK